jgi:hypothetical protein
MRTVYGFLLSCIGLIGLDQSMTKIKSNQWVVGKLKKRKEDSASVDIGRRLVDLRSK